MRAAGPSKEWPDISQMFGMVAFLTKQRPGVSGELTPSVFVLVYELKHQTSCCESPVILFGTQEGRERRRQTLSNVACGQ